MESLIPLGAAILAAIAGTVAVRHFIVRPEQVEEFERGLLYAQGRFLRLLGPGRYWLIRPWFNEELKTVDTRLSSASIPGQEIISKDKLPIRLTLIVQYRVAEPELAVHKVRDCGGLLYEEVQLLARELVSAETLDSLLEGRGAISTALLDRLKPRAAAYGLEVTACGLKDVILPGEIRAMMTKVAEAEKAAQAALITAREELASTRCQANTAKLIHENPEILRLKELQALSELAKKPGNNTIILGQPLSLGR